jgi:hypothetical protein
MTDSVRAHRAATRREQLVARMRAKGYWTVQDVADKVMLSTSAIYKWVEEAHVKTEKLGQTIFIQYDSVKTHLGPEMAKLLEL